MSRANFCRRIFIAGLLVIFGLAANGSVQAQNGKFTEWGWPQPYDKVSDKSVEWLKQKGWWPLQVAFQSPWSGQNNISIVMDKEGLLAKRGIEMKLTAFGYGPAVNEVLVSGKVQVASAGNFPYTSLLDKQIPVKVIALITPNILHATIVPLDSKIKSLADLKGSNPPATIGIVTGSSAEFYFQMAAQVADLKIGKDVILKNMPIGEQMALPKGIDAVVPWDAGAEHDRAGSQERPDRQLDLPVQYVRGQFRRAAGADRQRSRCRAGPLRCLCRIVAMDAAQSRRHGQASAGRSQPEEFHQGHPGSADPCL